MSESYDRIEDEHVVVVDMDEPWIKVACCDCGLVHCWAFGLSERDGKLILEINIDRLERCTAQKRRHGNVDLMLGKEKDLYKLVRK